MSRLNAPEFYNVWVASSLLLFGLNNFYLKPTYGNWLTGKLSDFLVCFFMPLLISALLAQLKIALHRRVWVGLLVTGTILTSINLSDTASHGLSQLLTPVARALGFGASHNTVDPSDLIALPVLVFTYKFAVFHGGKSIG